VFLLFSARVHVKLTFLYNLSAHTSRLFSDINVVKRRLFREAFKSSQYDLVCFFTDGTALLDVFLLISECVHVKLTSLYNLSAHMSRLFSDINVVKRRPFREAFKSSHYELVCYRSREFHEFQIDGDLSIPLRGVVQGLGSRPHCPTLPVGVS